MLIIMTTQKRKLIFKAEKPEPLPMKTEGPTDPSVYDFPDSDGEDMGFGLSKNKAGQDADTVTMPGGSAEDSDSATSSGLKLKVSGGKIIRCDAGITMLCCAQCTLTIILTFILPHISIFGT